MDRSALCAPQQLITLRAADCFVRYAIIARASGVKSVRDDDCTWDLQQSSTEVCTDVLDRKTCVTLYSS